MTPKQLHDLFRIQIGDVAEPYLFSKDEIYEFMTDAQRMLCRLTEGIADATTDSIRRLEFGPGDEYASMSPSIITVRGAWRQSDGREIEVHNIEDFRYGTGALNSEPDYGAGYTGPNTTWADGATWRVKQGPIIRAIILGMERNKARAFPISTVGDTINLEVYRLPLLKLSDSQNCYFEVDDQHHRHLLLWMKSLGYAKQDVDIRDDVKAKDYEKQFVDYCDQARREQGRAKHKPRTVLYGGI